MHLCFGILLGLSIFVIVRYTNNVRYLAIPSATIVFILYMLYQFMICFLLYLQQNETLGRKLCCLPLSFLEVHSCLMKKDLIYIFLFP